MVGHILWSVVNPTFFLMEQVLDPCYNRNQEDRKIDMTVGKGKSMKSLIGLIAVIVVLCETGVGLGQLGPVNPGFIRNNEPNAKVDQDKSGDGEDPLPGGSSLRFGSSRFRLGTPITSIAVSDKAKIAVVSNNNSMLASTRVYNLVTGREVFIIQRPPGGFHSIAAVALTSDGKILITKQSRGLSVLNAATGNEIRKIGLNKGDSGIRDGWFSILPDDKTIAHETPNAISLIDSASGETIRKFQNGFPVKGVAFSLDGKLLATGAYDNNKDTSFVRIWDVESGKELRQFNHGKKGGGIECLAFSPDAKTLVSGDDKGQLRLINVENGKEMKAFPQDREKIRSVTFAPDGNTIAAAGDSLRLFGGKTWAQQIRINRKVNHLQFTDNGKTLTGTVSGAIYRWDSTTGQSMTPDAGGETHIDQILISSNGNRLLTRGYGGDTHLWDGTNAKHLQAFTFPFQRDITMSPDGRFLAWPIVDKRARFTDPQFRINEFHDGSRLRIYDIPTDKISDPFPAFGGDSTDVTFTKDGKQIVSVDHYGGWVRIWIVETGKEVRKFQAIPNGAKNPSINVALTKLSLDGKTMAVASHPIPPDEGNEARYQVIIRLWDMATGNEKHRLVGHVDSILDMAISPDGQWLATTSKDRTAIIWDVVTGKKVVALLNELTHASSPVAFSCDSRFLAISRPDGVIQLWEVATWTKTKEFEGNPDRPTSLAFSPRWQLLSGNINTTVLSWDFRPASSGNVRSLETAWKELANSDSSKAFEIEGQFLASPRETVKWLDNKVKIPKAPDSDTIRKLITGLDNDEFTERESASKALIQLGQQAIPFLEANLQKGLSTEAGDRVKAILEQLRAIPISPEHLREMRAVMILEWIADSESKSLLKKWAGGPEQAFLTQEATGAVERLEVGLKKKE